MGPYLDVIREQNFCYSVMGRATCRYESSARRIISGWLQKMKAKPEVSSEAELRKNNNNITTLITESKQIHLRTIKKG